MVAGSNNNFKTDNFKNKQCVTLKLKFKNGILCCRSVLPMLNFLFYERVLVGEEAVLAFTPLRVGPTYF